MMLASSRLRETSGERDALGTTYLLDAALFFGCRRQRFYDGQGNPHLVSDADPPIDCAAELGFRAGMDLAVRNDGDCGVADLAAAAFVLENYGAGSLRSATGVELCMVVYLFSLASDWLGARGNTYPLGRDTRHDACIRSNFDSRYLADGSLPCMGYLCQRPQCSVLATEQIAGSLAQQPDQNAAHSAIQG